MLQRWQDVNLGFKCKGDLRPSLNVVLERMDLHWEVEFKSQIDDIKVVHNLVN